jgi:hypothetical protein
MYIGLQHDRFHLHLITWLRYNAPDIINTLIVANCEDWILVDFRFRVHSKHLIILQMTEGKVKAHQIDQKREQGIEPNYFILVF